MKGRRSTTTLTLVLIGAAALHGCGGDEKDQATRDVYRTRADCQRDWGDDPKKCEHQSSGSHSGFFYGPMYGHGRTVSSGSSTGLAPREGSNAVSSATVSRSTGSVARGGFGSSASAHSSSSSSS
jgi:uncharacterized protein YgiB involved in biofilm formation